MSCKAWRGWNLVLLFSFLDAPALASGWLDLPVIEVEGRYPPYAEFCARRPSLCDLDGPTVIEHSRELMRLLHRINGAVNADTRFQPDIQQYGVEDYWALPTSGKGDCEDIALEKRRRLVAAGLSPGALRLAFVYHRTAMCPHSLLTVETTQGTFLLDNLGNSVERWDSSPYNFEARERIDGTWERYDQGGWAYD